jgi:hypothetical protein
MRPEQFRREKMRRIPLSIFSILIVGTGVISCDAPRPQSPSTPSVSYEPRGTIDHAALAPLPGADSAAISDPSSSAASGTEPIASADGKMIWHSSRRWAAVKSNAKIEGNPN